MIMPRKVMVAAIVVVVFSGAVALYMFALPGFSSARRQPPEIEVAVATWLLRHSVPATARQQHNPLGADAADVAAGRDLSRQNCEICHGYDGSGRTQIGGGEYPRPPVLRSLIASMTDGEVFYHIRNGIRNTGMPAWTLPDRQVWQLVLYMRNLPKTVRCLRTPSPTRGLALRRIGILQGVPLQHLRPLEEDADGQRRA
jgi:mono/diheme cytochrome c family protein